MNLAKAYKKAFEQRCFLLLKEAYQTALKEKVIQLDWDENDISQKLHEKIDNNPKRLNWNIASTREEHIANNEKEEKGFADKLPRIDMKMSTILSAIEIKFFCEAKRLKQNDSKLKRAYINDGMDRYITKKYPKGCMLGYLLQGTVPDTVKGINSLLKKDNRKTEVLNSKQHSLLNDYYESNHKNNVGTIKHLIFDFT